MTKAYDISGKRFERLVAVRRIGSKKGGALWDCVCDCGGRREVTVSKLICGAVTMCGACASKFKEQKAKNMGLANRRHGMSKEVVYCRYRLMMGRCYDEKNDSYEYYGGRGIRVCDEWLNDRVAFMDWAIANGFHPSLSIDRIDNDGDYSPENCRWATDKQQHRNRSDNKILELDGVSMPMSAWSEKLGISIHALKHRVQRGWTDRRALTTLVGAR